MNKIYSFLLSFLLILFIQNYAQALDIIYPKQTKYNAWKNETYVLGNVQKGASLKINGEQVKIYPQNIFCSIVPLKSGENIITIEEFFQNKKITKIYKVVKPIPVKQKNNTTLQKPQIKRYKDLLYGTVITDGAPVREKPNSNGNRITHLPEKTIILIEAEFCDWYKIFVDNEKEPLWINKKNIKTLYSINNRYITKLNEVHFTKDKHFEKIKFDFDFPTPFKITEQNGNIELTIWGIKDITNLQKAISKQKVFSDIQIKSFENNNLTLLIQSESPLWGYDAECRHNDLIFIKRKTPKINPSKPLNNQIICIDAGHGGKETGTVGPGRIPEKDVNLDISLFLKNELEKNGAKVIMTRDTDVDTEIYQRPQIAKDNQAVILISIHANSMIDGNPYKNHGIETYYYNEQAKNLADTVKKQMIKELSLNDNGTNYASFVLTRPTLPVSILIETAYMPNPDEYLLLIDKNFQQKTAHAICEGLKNYFLIYAINKN